MFEITKDELRATVETPDKMMSCDVCGNVYYLKKIRGKSELLVLTQKQNEDSEDYNIVCFGWMEGIVYPSE